MFNNVAWNASKIITPEISDPKVSITTVTTESKDRHIDVVMGS